MRAVFESSCSPPSARLRITGDLDLSTSEELGQELDSLRTQGARDIEVDVAAVTFVDADTLAILHAEQRQLEALGGSLVMVAASEDHQAVARLAGYENLVARAGRPDTGSSDASQRLQRYRRKVRPDETSLAERMSKAARELQAEPDPQATMEAAVWLAAANVRGCDGAAITMAERRGRIDTPAYTDDVSLGGDLLQYELSEGPCLDALWEERVVHSADVGTDPRWPNWGPRFVSEYGVNSVLCFQLFTREESLGALNLYSRSRAAFDSQDRDDGLALAAHIAVAISAAQTEEQLSRALDSRSLISQSVGILMERYQLNSTAAFEVLSRVSSESNVKIRDIARELIETGRLRGAGSSAGATPDPMAPETPVT